MAMDEKVLIEFIAKQGEIIGTVGALVTTVSDMKAAILPALKEQRLEMAKYRDDCRASMDKHKDEDKSQHEILESLCRPIADLHDEIFGDGSKNGEPGLKADVADLKTGKVKLLAWCGGVGSVVGVAVVLIGWAVEAHYVK